MLITISIFFCCIEGSFVGNKLTNEIVSIQAFIEHSLVENKEKMNRTILSLSRSCQFNNPPLRRWKNATPAEKSTSYIHHHCRRHFCPVECVNFKRRNKKKSSLLLLLLLKKTHHHHHHLLYTITWSVVWLLTSIRTIIHIQLLFFFFFQSYLFMALVEKTKKRAKTD